MNGRVPDTLKLPVAECQSCSSCRHGPFRTGDAGSTCLWLGSRPTWRVQALGQRNSHVHPATWQLVRDIVRVLDGTTFQGSAAGCSVTLTLTVVASDTSVSFSRRSHASVATVFNVRGRAQFESSYMYLRLVAVMCNRSKACHLRHRRTQPCQVLCWQCARRFCCASASRSSWLFPRASSIIARPRSAAACSRRVLSCLPGRPMPVPA